MNTVYINKEKVWLNNEAYELSDKGLSDVFNRVKQKEGNNRIKVSLGRDVCSIRAIKMEGEINKDNVFLTAKMEIPFAITEESFDWRKVVLGEGDIWVQIVAVKIDLLQKIKQAMKGIGVETVMAVPAGLILATVSRTSEAPVLIKWQGKENISVLAIKGMVDVMGAMSDDEICTRAVKKWGLAVSPDQLVLTDDDFNFDREFAMFNTDGDDEEVVGICIKSNNV